MLPTLRVILSGKPMGPDIYEMLVATGKEESIKRLDYFVTHNNN
jgi:glutamyl/glutaminyl-tRNA synthetase